MSTHRTPAATRHRTSALWAALALGAVLTASACGAPADAGEGTASASGAAKVNTSPEQNRIKGIKDDAAAALLPGAVRDRGTIILGNASAGGGTPPLAFTADDDKTPIGVEIDLAYLFGETLGLTVEPQVTSWENLFVGIDSGKYDAALSNVTVTEERKEKYDFATYRKDDVAFETKKGSSWKVNSGNDIAGKTIAVGSGTNQEKLLVDWNEANIKAGLKPATIKYFQNQSDYYLALSSGRIDAYFGPNPSVKYHIATSGQTEEIGSFSGAGESLQGLIAVLTKQDSGLAKPFAAAINAAIANGTYAQVLDRWNLGNEAVATSLVNPPGLPKTA
jgi:polar amino acid transport system substrate-binding protein